MHRVYKQDNGLKLRYKVDLKRFMAECETNYFRLMQLFPDMQSGGERCIAIGDGVRRVVCIAVRERSRYTTLLNIAEHVEEESEWLSAPSLQVRLYHDARAAEVVVCEGRRRIKPRYDYPNVKMLHRDEKSQWNRFLGEWLASCLAHGYELEGSLLEGTWLEGALVASDGGT